MPKPVTDNGRAVAAIMATLAELELGKERRAASRQSRRDRSLPATKPHRLSAERQEQLRRLALLGNRYENWLLPSGLDVQLLIAICSPHEVMASRCWFRAGTIDR
jgi:hypothetical protein